MFCGHAEVIVVAESVVQSQPRRHAEAVLRKKVQLRIVIGAIEGRLCGRDRRRRRERKRPADGYVKVLRLILGEIEDALEDVFAIPARRQIAAVQAKKHAASGSDYVPVSRPDRTVDALIGMVMILVLIKRGAARQRYGRGRLRGRVG